MIFSINFSCIQQPRRQPMNEQTQIALIGGGIMSFTLATILKELQPSLQIHIYEMLDDVGLESSMAWNNAGTGHQALCELNYTPRQKDGSINITKALKINQQFELSKEFWAYCVKNNLLDAPKSFINPLPHLSFVADSNVAFLKDRFEALRQSPFYKNMLFSQDKDQIAQWVPLVMQDRDPNQSVAATFIDSGSDVNFGAIVTQLKNNLTKQDGIDIFLSHKVTDLNQSSKGWELQITDTKNDIRKKVQADFVFLGAGGGAFPLLQKSGIPEGRGYGGFPVSGLWLVCNNKDLIDKHATKVYGKASVGDPPMSVPHLDSRIIDGKKELMFGPYAGFNTKFLKSGSLLDFPLSARWNNIIPMLQAGIDNIPLTAYLVRQVFLNKKGRVEKLEFYMPSAKEEDWDLKLAGQRVQIIKKNAQGRGFLEFGTEVVVSADKSLAAVLGASPGASISIDVILELLEKCFATQVSKNYDKLKEMIPSYKNTLEQNIAAFNTQRSKTAQALQMPFTEI